MTKHIFSNGMLAHVWAQQEQSHGRSGNGNFRFDGSTLYSYREPIARFTISADGRSVVLITSETFSVTTSAHTSRAGNAVHGQTVFRVPDTGYDSVEPDHATNLRHLLKQAREPLGKVSRMPFDSWSARPVRLAGIVLWESGVLADWPYAAGALLAIRANR